ncbi:MAG: flavin reductase family protein [Nocardioides sp.]
MTVQSETVSPETTSPETVNPAMTMRPAAGLPGPPGDTLRSVMRHHAASVVIITTSDGEPSGFCATSLTSVSLTPPIVSFAVASASAAGRAWATARHGLVHLLRADQGALAARFARSGSHKFARPTSWRAGPAGQPLLDGVLAWLLVRPFERLVMGDHLMVICDVEASRLASRDRSATGSLVYHDGDYYALPGRVGPGRVGPGGGGQASPA